MRRAASLALIGNFVVWVLLLTSALVAIKPARANQPLTREIAQRYARAFLSPEDAARIAGGEYSPGFRIDSTRPVPPGDVRLFSGGMRVAADICRRDNFFASLEPTPFSERRVFRSFALAAANDCASATGYGQAQSSEGTAAPSQADAVAAFRDLLDARRPESKSDYVYTCESKMEAEACTGEMEVILANLPMQNVFIIDKTGPSEWVFTMVPKAIGGPIWSVTLRTPPGSPRSIRMVKTVPPPF